MVYKRPPFPIIEGTSPHKSALKGIIRALGPHNPAHRAIGDDSDAAHDTPEFQKAGDAYQAEQDTERAAYEEKQAANPNKEKIAALRKEIQGLDFTEFRREEELREQIEALEDY